MESGKSRPTATHSRRKNGSGRLGSARGLSKEFRGAPPAPTSNIEHPTSNVQLRKRVRSRLLHWKPRLCEAPAVPWGNWALDVGCSAFSLFQRAGHHDPGVAAEVVEIIGQPLIE